MAKGTPTMFVVVSLKCTVTRLPTSNIFWSTAIRSFLMLERHYTICHEHPVKYLIAYLITFTTGKWVAICCRY